MIKSGSQRERKERGKKGREKERRPLDTNAQTEKREKKSINQWKRNSSICQSVYWRIANGNDPPPKSPYIEFLWARKSCIYTYLDDQILAYFLRYYFGPSLWCEYTIVYRVSRKTGSTKKGRKKKRKRRKTSGHINAETENGKKNQ